MDGVLVDVSASYHRCIETTVNALAGAPPAPDAIDAVKLQGGFNDDFDTCVEIVRRMTGRAPRLADVVRIFQSAYDGTPEAPGLREAEELLISRDTLEALRGYALGIVTGRPTQGETLYPLRRAGFADRFACVVTRADVSAGKPDPEGLYVAMRRLSASPHESLYLGDIVDDATAALRAGVPFVGIAPARSAGLPSLRVSGLTAAGALQILSHVNELPAWLAAHEARGCGGHRSADRQAGCASKPRDG